MHNIGSKLSRFALLDQYEGRLGLSAIHYQDEEYKETLIKYKKEQTDEHVKKLRPYQLDAKNNWIENNHDSGKQLQH